MNWDEPPGLDELRTMCRNARDVAELCDLLRLGELDNRSSQDLGEFLRRLPSGAAADVVTVVREYDPDVDPYIWELDPCQP